jgi:predicted lipid-binding transport protein (Tim44 family)
MSIRLTNWRLILTVCWCASLLLALAFAPAPAEARAGHSFGGNSSGMGSRGSRSWENNGAQPLGRSPAPMPQTAAPYGSGGYNYGGGFMQRHPFLTGMAGGLFGSWLFGHSAWAGGGGGFGAGIGTVMRLLLLGLLVWFVVRLFRRGFSSGGFGGGQGLTARSAGAAATGRTMDRGRDVNLADADLNTFQQIHAAVQQAWSAADLGRLRQLMTPEMLSYFSDELARNASQGVQNVVSGVNLLGGELSESWEEGDLQYASALMRWRAVDYVVRLGRAPGDADFVVGGDPRTPVEAEEMWTFVRRRGGNWLLSAIQQM